MEQLAVRLTEMEALSGRHKDQLDARKIELDALQARLSEDLTNLNKEHQT